MAKITSVVCDICGTQKREFNHWYVVLTTSHEEFVLVPSDIDSSAWSEKEKKDVCGSDCASKALSQYLNSLNTKGVEEKRVTENEALK